MPPQLLTAPFDGWDTFYLIVGTAAGALTGLQFVVMALIADVKTNAGESELGAFGTPNVVHFCMVLLLSSIAAAPWHRVASAGAAIAAAGAGGVAYAIIVVLRTFRTMAYKPVLEDWLWHAVFPLAAYVSVLVSSVWMQATLEPALFLLGAAQLLLLFVGIHNAWDTVTFIAMNYLGRDDRDGPPAPPPPPPPGAILPSASPTAPAPAEPNPPAAAAQGQLLLAPKDNQQQQPQQQQHNADIG